VRVVDPKNPNSVIDPEQNDVTKPGPQALHGRVGIEFDVHDIFVFLGRVLGETDRPIPFPAKPLWVLFQPGMIRRALDGEIKSELQSLFHRGISQSNEIVERAERRTQH
jgi:hypothetical protein